MSKITLFVIVLGIIVCSLFFIRFFIGGSEDTWICQKGEWIKHGNPTKSQPQILCK